jgi:uncharacterized lipoprotein YddW (UPF0748 family)
MIERVMRPLLLLALLVLPLGAQQYRAFWADAFHPGFKTAAEVDQMVERLVQAKANAVFMQARRRGDSYYLQSREPLVDDPALQPGFDPLEYLIFRAHERNIEVHAWFVVYPAWLGNTAPRDANHVWNRHGPDRQGLDNWVNYNAAGGRASALDPGHPGVLPYLVDVFLEPVRRYNLDGIHLDYIRYPEDADYGYNPASIERFNRHESRAGRPQQGEARWSEWRRRQVTSLVRQLYLRLQIERPRVKLSAATITWGDGPRSDTEFRTKDAYSRVFQDWRGWLEEGILDLAMPMNYFREPQFAGYLDRWTEFQKNHQGRRAIVNGLGIYLNPFEVTLSQSTRVLKPSELTGNRVLGICYYSYSANASGMPEVPNPEFFRLLESYFGETSAVPELPWKVRPEGGHVAGQITVEEGPWWLNDGADVQLEALDGSVRRTLASDVSGFFGSVELPRGQYRVRVLRDGKQLHESEAQWVEPGRVTEFAVRLSGADAGRVLPFLEPPAGRGVAVPGDLLRLTGRNLAPAFAPARAVPLPLELAGARVFANGIAVPLLAVAPDAVEIQLPYATVARWEIVLRRAGMESPPVEIAAAPAAPLIHGIYVGQGFLEIYATGLGATAPPIAAGVGGNGQEPYHRVAARVRVLLDTPAGEVELEPLYAGLQPYLPGRYQVNVLLPAGVNSGQVRLKVGEALSAPAAF